MLGKNLRAKIADGSNKPSDRCACFYPEYLQFKTEGMVRHNAGHHEGQVGRYRLRAGCPGAGFVPEVACGISVTHHSDHGCQYVSIRYTKRLAEADLVASVGSVGDSYDNALAEIINGLYRTELIYRQGPRKNMEAVELATLKCGGLVQ